MIAGLDSGPLVFVELGPGVLLRVAVPVPKQREIAAEFLTAMNAAIDAVAQRYAPNHRGFLTELRERVLIGIEPARLGRSGMFGFVDRVGYRMWNERQADARERARLVAAEHVTEPAGETGEPARGDRDVC